MSLGCGTLYVAEEPLLDRTAGLEGVDCLASSSRDARLYRGSASVWTRATPLASARGASIFWRPHSHRAVYGSTTYTVQDR